MPKQNEYFVKFSPVYFQSHSDNINKKLFSSTGRPLCSVPKHTASQLAGVLETSVCQLTLHCECKLEVSGVIQLIETASFTQWYASEWVHN